jgi:hypothetical protein
MPVNDDRSPYDVGFGKPPKDTQFRKGTSGNPRGRPRGKGNLATDLDRALQEKVTINESGMRKTVTKREAVAKQLVNKAASGDIVAIRLLTALTSAIENAGTETGQTHLSDEDLKVLDGVLKRFEKSGKGEDHGNDK